MHSEYNTQRVSFVLHVNEILQTFRNEYFFYLLTFFPSAVEEAVYSIHLSANDKL